MKAVILAGGLGTRLSEETHLKQADGGSRRQANLWHILKIYSSFGINEFVICCGYKGYLIKEYFANYFMHTCDVTFHLDEDNRMEVHHRKSEPWKVTLVDTGDESMTGGRLGRVADYLGEDSSASLTEMALLMLIFAPVLIIIGVWGNWQHLPLCSPPVATVL